MLHIHSEQDSLTYFNMKTPDWFENYHSLQESQFRLLNDTCKGIKGDIRNLKENHLAHLQDELTEIATNQKWLMKTYWILVSACIGSMVTAIATLILK